MPFCACRTKLGEKCKHRAASGSRFCKRHEGCTVTADELDTVEVDEIASAGKRVIDKLYETVRVLQEERNLYESKLSNIELMAYTESDGTPAMDSLADKVIKEIYRRG